VLDGDELRDRLPPQLGFSTDARSNQFARALFIAELLSAHGIVAILALVAPFASDRDGGRDRFAAAGWFEVYLDPPQRICIQRDSRGLYARLAARGGSSLIESEVFERYEPPQAPALRLDTNRLTVADSTAAILELLAAKTTR